MPSRPFVPFAPAPVATRAGQSFPPPAAPQRTCEGLVQHASSRRHKMDVFSSLVRALSYVHARV